MKTEKQNYTEKITLRLTPEDKENFQNEADSKKLPLTTLLRNKLNGIEVQDEVFEPKLIHYDRSEHNRKQHQANLQLKKFEQITVEASRHIDLPTNNKGLTELLTNPYAYVSSKIEAKHRKDINIPISKEKLFELLEIDLSGLNALTNEFNNKLLTVDENTVKTRDFRSEFESYTSNALENKRLETSLRLINSFSEMIGNGHNNYNIHELKRISGNKLSYSNGLIPSLNYIKQ